MKSSMDVLCYTVDAIKVVLMDGQKKMGCQISSATPAKASKIEYLLGEFKNHVSSLTRFFSVSPLEHEFLLPKNK